MLKNVVREGIRVIERFAGVMGYLERLHEIADGSKSSQLAHSSVCSTDLKCVMIGLCY